MICVGFSGGVDSAAVARILLERGETVLPVFLCLHSDNGAEAKKRARELGLDLRILDARGAFTKKVVEPFLNAYACGKTPNPCLNCNRDIKFGLLLDYALKHGCKKTATGHYARLVNGRIKRALDSKKDQSYAFALVPKKALEFIELPLGEKKKSEVKRVANWRGSESQDLCFASSRLDALKSLPRKKGFFYYDNEIVGEHEGAWFYCIGQRRGIGNKRLYVKEVDAQKNVVVLAPRNELYCESFTVTKKNLHGTLPEEIDLIVRHRQKTVRARVHGDTVTPLEPLWSPSPGQVAGFYDDDLLAGGAIITKIRWRNN
jgi:tRNA-uridine 2-sulfurtransferase